MLCFCFVATISVLNCIFVGHYDKSMLPHCWYTWLVISLIPVMFVAGMLVQFLKTGKDHDHRQGEERHTHMDRQSDIHADRQTDRQAANTINGNIQIKT